VSLCTWAISESNRWGGRGGLFSAKQKKGRASEKERNSKGGIYKHGTQKGYTAPQRARTQLKARKENGTESNRTRKRKLWLIKNQNPPSLARDEGRKKKEEKRGVEAEKRLSRFRKGVREQRKGWEHKRSARSLYWLERERSKWQTQQELSGESRGKAARIERRGRPKRGGCAAATSH